MEQLKGPIEHKVQVHMVDLALAQDPQNDRRLPILVLVFLRIGEVVVAHELPRLYEHALPVLGVRAQRRLHAASATPASRQGFISMQAELHQHSMSRWDRAH